MQIKENVPLAEYTTFKIGGPARYFCAVKNEAELLEAVKFGQDKKLPLFILGGGSNILISDSGFAGLVIKVELKGVIYKHDKVTAAAGEMWDEFVDNTLEHGLFGLENLSAIPGMVGAAAVQNIGAYGAEASSFIVSVKALDTTTLKFLEIRNSQCDFSYRDSVFKREKGRYIITAITFKLLKKAKVNIEYRDLAEYFGMSIARSRRVPEVNPPCGAISGRREDLTQGQGGASNAELKSPSPREVRDAVIEIRWGKLPDWKLWGTAGSFFKNPIIELKDFIDLKQKYPDLPGYPEPKGQIKVSLGWILDKVCNFKGVCVDNVCVYEKQALVLVSEPGAKAEDVISLSRKMSQAVKDKTGLEIEAEVEWVN